jgi:hypothetical protein
MNTLELMKKTLLASMIAATLGLAGCSADGDDAGNGNGSVSDCGADGVCGNADDNGGLGPNNGSTPTTVGEDSNGDGTITDDELTGPDGTKGFVCSKVATDIASPIRTEVGANGLIGGVLGPLLALLGGDSLNTLLGSVTEPDNVIDGRLATYATFTSTAGGLGGLLNSVDLDVVYPSSTDMKGTYAVFGLSFPGDTVELSLANQITVKTYKGSSNTAVETLTVNQNALNLLGANLLGAKALWFGIKTTKDYDRVALSLTPGLLSATVGDAMFAHELCAGGKYVTPPATN